MTIVSLYKIQKLTQKYTSNLRKFKDEK